MNNQKQNKVCEELAILGGTPIRKTKFLYSAIFEEEEKEAILEVMENGELSGFYKDFEGGKKVQDFQRKWANYFGSKNAIAVNSGTSALHVAIAASGIGPGDEVIVPAYSFTATASSVVMNNAIPIFCDIDPITFNIDVKKIEKLITDKTKAIIPVHLFGKPAEMDAIMDLSKKHGLIVIEDACQSPGTKYNGKFTGTIGHFGVFSTVETKNLVTGEGGMIVTNDDELAYKCKLVRNHGEAYMKGKPREYLSNMLGYNLRPLEIQAAVGIEQLKKIKRINRHKNKLANYLLDNLKGLTGILLPEKSNNLDIIHHLLCLQYDENETGVNKALYMEALQKEGIEVTAGYPHPMYMNPIFQEKIAYGAQGCPFTCSFYGKEVNYQAGICPESELVCDKAIFITHIRHPNVIEDMKDIVEGFKKVNNSLEKLRSIK